MNAWCSILGRHVGMFGLLYCIWNKAFRAELKAYLAFILGPSKLVRGFGSNTNTLRCLLTLATGRDRGKPWRCDDKR
jgi:hypothetical protein